MILSSKKLHNQGFSMVELIVVISIFALMASTTIFNYNDYRDRVEETNIAQDIALSVRQAQLYGISSSNRDVGQVFDDDENNAAEKAFFNGVDITDNSSIRGVAINVKDKTFTLFEDNNGNNVYDSGIDRVIDERQVLSNRVELKACLDNGTPDLGNCSSDLVTDDELIYVTFQRPYPDAIIRLQGDDTTYSNVSIGFYTGGNEEVSTYIQIDPSGQISVKK